MNKSKRWISGVEIAVSALITLSLIVIGASGFVTVKAQDEEAVCREHFRLIYRALRAYMDEWGTVQPQVGVEAELSEIGVPPKRMWYFPQGIEGELVSLLNIRREWTVCPVWENDQEKKALGLRSYCPQIYVGENRELLPEEIRNQRPRTREMLSRYGSQTEVLLDLNHPGREIVLRLDGTIEVRNADGGQ
jgi:hypothetical protein